MEHVHVAFPNLDYDKIPVNVVKKWNITEPKEIGDTVFFWVGDVCCKMFKDEYDNLFNNNLKTK